MPVKMSLWDASEFRHRFPVPEISERVFIGRYLWNSYSIPLCFRTFWAFHANNGCLLIRAIVSGSDVNRSGSIRPCSMS